MKNWVAKLVEVVTSDSETLDPAFHHFSDAKRRFFRWIRIYFFLYASTPLARVCKARQLTPIRLAYWHSSIINLVWG